MNAQKVVFPCGKVSRSAFREGASDFSLKGAPLFPIEYSYKITGIIMEYLCDVIVPTWNKCELIKQFIASYLASINLPTRLIIIDNGSTDGTKDFLTSLKDTPNCKFEIILNQDNLGYIKGVNQGFDIIQSPYVCLANNDLLFTKGWLEELLAVFNKDSRIGLLNPNSNNLGAHLPSGMSIDDFALTLRSQYQGSFTEMPFCIGFCMCVKKEVIQKIGKLSEEFFPMFFEDSDYSLRVIKANYLIGVARASYVWHKEHGSFNKMGESKIEGFFKNSRNIFNKKWGRILRIAYIADGSVDRPHLDNVLNLARQGNFISLFSRYLQDKPKDIFSKFNYFEHTAIKFVEISNVIGLLWRILTKKKKFDVIVSDNEFLGKIVTKFGFNFIKCCDVVQVNKFKFS